jgi:hypothetical protein
MRSRLPTYDAALQTVARSSEEDFLLFFFLLGRHSSAFRVCANKCDVVKWGVGGEGSSPHC